MKDLFKHAVQPVLQKQTLFQLSQLKSFVDMSLKEAISKSFENDADKIRHLSDTLYNIRDFVLAQTTENSLRLSLVQEFQQIEKAAIIELKNEEVKIESTPNS